MNQYLVIHSDDVYIVEDVKSYDEALDYVSTTFNIPRNELILECEALEAERRQFEANGVN